MTHKKNIAIIRVTIWIEAQRLIVFISHRKRVIKKGIVAETLSSLSESEIMLGRKGIRYGLSQEFLRRAIMLI